jgi:hypothetical protein
MVLPRTYLRTDVYTYDYKMTERRCQFLDADGCERSEGTGGKPLASHHFSVFLMLDI